MNHAVCDPSLQCKIGLEVLSGVTENYVDKNFYADYKSFQANFMLTVKLVDLSPAHLTTSESLVLKNLGNDTHGL